MCVTYGTPLTEQTLYFFKLIPSVYSWCMAVGCNVCQYNSI